MNDRQAILHLCLPAFAIQVLDPGAVAQGRPVACADLSRTNPVVLQCTSAARRDGVRPGMLMSRALGACPLLDVIDRDSLRIEHAHDALLRRLEALGAEVEPGSPGTANCDILPLRDLYGGISTVVAAIATAFARAEDVRMGLAPNPFVAEVVAGQAASGTCLSLPAARVATVMPRLPITVLPLDEHTRELFRVLGLETCGDLAAISRDQVADRFGRDGLRLWELAQGHDSRQIVPRVPPELITARMEFPEAIGNQMVLERALLAVLEQACADERLLEMVPRTCTVTARLAGGGSWQVRRILREPTSDARRMLCATSGELAAIPAPVTELGVRFDVLTMREADQPELAAEAGLVRAGVAAERRRASLRRGIEHLQQAVGEDALLQVLELDPDSGVPERRAVLVPRGTAVPSQVQGA